MAMDTASFRLTTDMLMMEMRPEDRLPNDAPKRCRTSLGRKTMSHISQMVCGLREHPKEEGVHSDVLRKEGSQLLKEGALRSTVAQLCGLFFFGHLRELCPAFS